MSPATTARPFVGILRRLLALPQRVAALHRDSESADERASPRTCDSSPVKTMMPCSWRSGTAGLLFLAAAAEAFVMPAMTPAQNHRSLSLRHGLSPLHMALSGGEPVIVYGGFERIGDPSVCPSRAHARRRACTSWRIYEAFPDRIA